MTDYKNVARLVEDIIDEKTLQSRLFSRPLKTAFVIKDDLDIGKILKVLEYNSSIWGGYYNCLIPTNGKEIEKDWWGQLRNHNSDIIIFCGNSKADFSTALIHLLENKLDPFNFYYWNWRVDLVERHQQGVQDIFGNIPILTLVDDFISKQREVQEGTSNVRIPKCDSNSIYYICLATKFGTVNDLYKDLYQSIFKAEFVNFDKDLLDSYLVGVANFENKLTPLGFTKRITQITHAPTFEVKPKGLNIYLIGNKPVYDISLFWNSRLLINFWDRGQSKDLFLPINVFRSKRNIEILKNHVLKAGYWHSHTINLIANTKSRSIYNKRIISLADRLKNNIGPNIDIVTITKLFPITDFKLQSTEVGEEVKVKNDKFSFKRSFTSYGDGVRKGSWVVDIELRDDLNRIFQYPDESNLNHLLCGSPKKSLIKNFGYWIRPTRNVLSFKVNSHNNFMTGFLPSSYDALFAFFEDRNFQLKLTDKSPLAERVINLFGSLQELNLLNVSGIRNLLWEMQRSNRAFTINELIKNLKYGSKSDSVIDKLVRKRVLLRGITFVCINCNLKKWYPINDVNEVMQCSGCLSNVYPPIRINFSFKLNEMIFKAVMSGIIPALMTHYNFRLNFERPVSLFDVEISEIGKSDKSGVEIDYLSYISGNIILVECKEFKYGIYDKEIRKTITQLHKQIKLARKVGAPRVILATLLEDIPKKLVENILSLNKNKEVGVHIVNLNKMKILNLKNTREEIDFTIQNVLDVKYH